MQHFIRRASSTAAPRPAATDAQSQKVDNSPDSNYKDTPKCWICLVDDADQVATAALLDAHWRRPCGCSLVAHESCLRAWISQTFTPRSAVKCPQCGMPYKLRYHTSVLFAIMNAINEQRTYGVLIALGTGVAMSAYAVAFMYGVRATGLMGGNQFAMQLIGEGRASSSPPSIGRMTRLWIGWPLVPFYLMASRFDMFDMILPLIPPILLELPPPTSFIHSTASSTSLTLDPALALCVVPWLRVVYNGLWRHLVTPVTTRWRVAEMEGLGEESGRDEEGGAMGAEIFGMNIGIDARLQVNEIPEHADGGEEDAAEDDAAPGGGQERVRQMDTINMFKFVDMCVGALLLPDIAAVMGGYAVNVYQWC